MVQGDTNAKLIAEGIERMRRFIPEETRDQLTQIGFLWERAMKKRLRSGSTPPGVRKPKNTPTGNRTKRLSRSLFSEAKFTAGSNSLQGLTLFFGSRMPGEFNYARVQEEGATIRPKTKKFLAIPLPAAFRGTAANAEPPRSFNNTFVLRTKTGSLFIVQDTGGHRGGEMKFLFRLVREVTIPPRLGMKDEMRKIFKKDLRFRIGKALEKAGERAFNA